MCQSDFVEPCYRTKLELVNWSHVLPHIDVPVLLLMQFIRVYLTDNVITTPNYHPLPFFYLL